MTETRHANHRTTTLTLSRLYDAIQTGDVEAKMGDLFNGKYLMVNSFHLVDIREIQKHCGGEEMPELFVVEAHKLNTSLAKSNKANPLQQHDGNFTEVYISIHPDHRKALRDYDHIEVISRTVTPFSL